MHGHRVTLAVVGLASFAFAQARDHKIVNSYPSPHTVSYTGGLAFNRGILWVSAALGTATGTIYYIDAYTGTVLGSIPAPTMSMRGLTHDGATLWAASWSDNRVYRLIDTTGTVISSFPAFTLPAHPDGLAWDGNLLLISDESNQIHWFTPTGIPVRSISVPVSGAFNPRDLGWDGATVYAGYQSSARIRRHDPANGNILLDIPSPSGGFQQGVEWGDWHLWTTGGNNASIYQIDIGPPYLELVGTMSFPNSIQFRLTDAQARVGDLAIVLLSRTGVGGFSAGSVTVPLTFDVLTQVCLGALPSFAATVNQNGTATTPLVPVPPVPSGLVLWAAAVTLNGANITSVTDPIRIVTQ
jgi:glutamine cyclotransferase